jgi:hypothetical protein
MKNFIIVFTENNSNSVPTILIEKAANEEFAIDAAIYNFHKGDPEDISLFEEMVEEMEVMITTREIGLI